MSDLNQYTCTARLGAEPDCRTFASGDPVVNLRVAVGEQWKDSQTGEKKQRTLWLPVKITNKGLCSIAERFLKKGSKVALSGKLESRSFDKDGVETWVTELVLGPFNSNLTMLDSQGGNPSQSQDPQRPSAGVPPAFDGAGEDDLPF
jgi:single-strand DNA-binding protein